MSTRNIEKRIFWSKMEESQENLSFLLKYFPKYYKNLDYDAPKLKKYKILSKIKNLKIVQYAKLKNYNTRNKINLLIKTLKPQQNYLKHLDGAHPQLLQHLPSIKSISLHIQNFSSWRSFLRLLHLESLKLDFSSLILAKNTREAELEKIMSYLRSRFWIHLCKLRSLSHLSLHFGYKFDEFLSRFIKKLASFKSLLSSLKSLTIYLNSIDSLEVSAFRDFTEIFQYTTNLKALELPYKLLEKLMEPIGAYQRLKSLCIIKNIRSPKEMDSDVNLSFLKGLESLESLKVLELSVVLDTKGSVLSFLRSFTVPKGLQTMKLNFHEINWKFLKGSNFNFDDSFFESSLECQSFYTKWNQITQLNSLTVCFVESEENNTRVNVNFLIPLLKNLSYLSKFYFANQIDPSHSKKNSVNLSLLWQSFSHLQSTLKTIYIESPSISINDMTNSGLSDQNILQKCGLCGKISGDKNLPTLFKLFPKGIVPHEHKKSQLDLESLVVENKDTFLQILKELNHIPRDLTLSIDINVRSLTSEDFVRSILEVLPRIYKDNFLKLSFSDIAIMEAHLLKEMIEGLVKCEISDLVKIVDKRENILFFGDGLYVKDRRMRDEERVPSSGNGDEANFLEFSEMYDDEDFDEDAEEEEEESEMDNFFTNPPPNGFFDNDDEEGIDEEEEEEEEDDF